MQPGAVAAWCNHAHARPDRRCSPGLRLTLLGSVREVDDGDLPELYGYPADHRGVWVRANFIASVDGGATVEGTTGGLGGPATGHCSTCCARWPTSSWSARAPCG
ncbi:bifunctional enzyme riboflavin biosynthesis RibD domain protein [Mycobacterium xenopi 4042]|uniref:Bifunctional enzyme riboflavin biosynthesis RibD domain protein n=1 Tax=Mycobacterium xenopi 4042 TaxID=1299334 RepID=X8CH74_MYCXE|nr:bifunctional enzyme riboflavin biosynthesis RibD domain protein [Mycobacterium xenopi 4042]